jgi:hypothetical protein
MTGGAAKMGLFKRRENEPEHAEFMGLVLEPEVLHTPVGGMPIADIRRAEFLRTIIGDGYGLDETSVPAVVGGAVVGGALFGTAGAVVGGLAGSTVKERGDERLKTTAVQLIFATDTLDFAMDIPRDQEGAAYTFSETVKRAMKQHEH